MSNESFAKTHGASVVRSVAGHSENSRRGVTYRRVSHNPILYASVVLFIVTTPSWCNAQSIPTGLVNATITFRVGGDHYEGQLLYWTSDEIFVLRRDGALARADRRLATDFQVINDHFVALDAGALRAQLLRELGGGYTVDTTSHYLVVRPTNKAEDCRDILEATYRNIQRFAAQRRIPLRESPFPLVAIVLATQNEYLDYLRRLKRNAVTLSNTLGCYDPISNRVVTFVLDATQQRSGGLPAGSTLPNVIRHEAFHQAAANMGLVSRFADVPLWFHEGMALMFEGDFVNPVNMVSGRATSQPRDLRFQARMVLAKQSSGWLRGLVVSDDLFSTHPETAYTLSWILMTYLHEKHHRAFVRYLTTINRLAPFETIPPPRRLADFVETFGDRWEVLEASVRKFADEI